ncbi:MAG: hypothetical protein IKM59_01515 [Oscillospiraceae bacterium]|nr:hypothetical protein [Oscillospiraceae bacterium]
MEILEYFESKDQEAFIQKIAACHWSAARFLADLLQKGTFRDMLGGWGQLFLLMDGENRVDYWGDDTRILYKDL